MTTTIHPSSRHDYIMDFEFSRLPSGTSSWTLKNNNAKLNDKHLQQLAKRFTGSNPLEMAIMDKNGMVKNVIIGDYTSDIDKELDNLYNVEDIFSYQGQKIKGRTFVRQIETKEDILEALSLPNSKGKTLTAAQKEWYITKVLPNAPSKNEVFYEIIVGQQRILASSFAYKHFLNKTPQERALEVQEYMNRVGIGSNVDIRDSQGMVDSALEFARKIVAEGKVKNINIGAWNPEAEMGMMTSIVFKSGDQSLIKDWSNLLKNKKIVFDPMQKGYTELMYSLLGNDKGFLDKLKIPIYSEYMNEFGYNIGQSPKNFREFEAALPWSLESAKEMISWYKPMQDLLKGGSEAHHASPDVVLSNMMETVNIKVLEKAKEIARNQNIPIDPDDAVFRKYIVENNPGVFKDAFEEVVRTDPDSLLKGMNQESAREQLNKAIRTIEKKAERQGKFFKNVIRKAGSSGSGYGTIWDKPATLKKAIAKYGTVAGLGALILGATYLSTSGESETDQYGGKLGDIKKKKDLGMASGIDMKETGDVPIVQSNFFSTTVPTMAGSLGFFALMGWRAQAKRGEMLGFVGKEADNYIDSFKNIFKLARIGIHEISSYVPFFRALKLDPAINFWFDSKNYGEYAPGKFKGSRFKIYDSKIKDFAEKRRAYIDPDFYKIAEQTNPTEAVKLKEWMDKGRSFDSEIDEAFITVSKDKRGNAVVIQELIQKDGTYLDNEILNLDFEPFLVNTKSPNVAGRGKTPKERIVSGQHNPMRNSIVEDFLYKTQTDSGLKTDIDFDTHLGKLKRPSFATEGFGKTAWELWKHLEFALELGPKGINQTKSDYFKFEHNIESTDKVIGVRGFTGDKYWSFDNLKVKSKLFSYFGRELISSANRFLETPFEAIFIDPTKYIKKFEKLSKSDNALNRIYGRIGKFVTRPHLGLNFNEMKGGVGEYLLKFGLKRILPLGVAYYGLGTIDKVLGFASGDKTGAGPMTNIPTKIIEGAALGYSKISDILGLTTVAKNQKDIAPGTTGLGFFAPAVTLMGAYGILESGYKYSPGIAKSYLRGVGKTLSTGTNQFINNSLSGKLAEVIGKQSLFKNAFKYEAFKGALNKNIPERILESFVKSPKKTLFGAGIALMTPFIPGFLGSTKSYTERKAEYEGKKDVAIRKNRGWILSPQAFEGERVKQYRRHALNLFESNWENSGVVWPSWTSRLVHGASFGLLNRYALEEYHKDSQPVYETAPYGASVPIVGPLIAATIGKIIKPVQQMHSANEDISAREQESIKYPTTDVSISKGNYAIASQNAQIESDQDITSQSDIAPMSSQFMSQMQDLVGIKGFALASTISSITGADTLDQYTPYKQSAQQFYNPAQYLWQYQAGDVSVVGGEFLRRIFQAPPKRWEVNNLKNELYGQDWIPKRYQTGTTFDKIPMGWLYGSRKGWEFLDPRLKGKDLSQYEEHQKLTILKYIAPHSREFDMAAQESIAKAVRGGYSLEDEQKVYNSIAESKELRKKVYAHAATSSFRLQTTSNEGVVTSVDPSSMTFTIDSYGERKFKLAGVASNEEDIRASLLRKNQYYNTQQLDEDAKNIMEHLRTKLMENISIGQDISVRIASEGSFSGGDIQEAIVGGLNKSMLNEGSPLVDTGNLAKYNISQDRSPIGSRALSQYWKLLSDHNSFMMKKMIGDRDYLTKYQNDQVFNRAVKLWTKPIEHFLKPMISTIGRMVGIDTVPGFTKHRRELQQYWDVIKYVKYKSLSSKFRKSDQQLAETYEKLANKTMVGADPMHISEKDIEASLPFGEKDYFSFFANEPDESKRGEIHKYLPEASKRIYEAIWSKKLVEGGQASSDDIDRYNMLEATGGYDASDEDIKDWRQETGGRAELGEYLKARFVNKYAKTHGLPSASWQGWSENVSIENVELLALKEAGEQVQDFGYFDEKMRTAAYDKLAYVAASTIRSDSMSNGDLHGTVLPNLMSGSIFNDSYNLPTTSQYPISAVSMTSNKADKDNARTHMLPPQAAALDDLFLMLPRLLR